MGRGVASVPIPHAFSSPRAPQRTTTPTTRERTKSERPPPPLPHINDDSNIVCTPMGASTGRLGVCWCVGRRVCVCVFLPCHMETAHTCRALDEGHQPNRPRRHPRSTARSCFALLKERHCTTHPLWGRASERWAWVPARGVGRPMPAVDSMLNRQGKGKCCL